MKQPFSVDRFRVMLSPILMLSSDQMSEAVRAKFIRLQNEGLSTIQFYDLLDEISNAPTIEASSFVRMLCNVKQFYQRPTTLVGTQGNHTMLGLFDGLAKYEKVYAVDGNTLTLTEAVFLRDFFPWQKGDKAHQLTLVNTETPPETWLEEENQEGKTVARVRVQLDSCMRRNVVP